MAVLYVMFAVSVYKMNLNGKGIGIRRAFTMLMELPTRLERAKTSDLQRQRSTN